MGYYYNLFSIMWALILMTVQHAHCGIFEMRNKFRNKNASILERRIGDVAFLWLLDILFLL